MATMTETWVPDELQTSRDVHGEPSGTANMIVEVQKLHHHPACAETGLQNFQERALKIEVFGKLLPDVRRGSREVHQG